VAGFQSASGVQCRQWRNPTTSVASAAATSSTGCRSDSGLRAPAPPVEIQSVNCFCHDDRPAVGTCIACHRAVCRDCAVEIEQAIACHDRCEREVRRIINLRAWSFRQQQFQVLYWRRWRAIFAALGVYLSLVGLVVGLVAYSERAFSFAILCASATALGAVMLFMYSQRSPFEQLRACGACGYNLTGNTSGRCPECGAVC
jgi:hypothetical protein